MAKAEAVFTINDLNTLTRMALARAMTPNIATIEDFYRACKYPTDLVIDDFHQQYEREGVAAKVVNLWADECWERPPELYENDDIGTETAFEEYVADVLIKRHGLWEHCKTADQQCGIGRYGVTYINFGDATSVAELALPPRGWPEGADFSKIETEDPETQIGQPRDLLFMRVLPEKYATIRTVETNVLSPRYGQPVLYGLQFGAADGIQSGNVDSTTYDVHWTRVVHHADNKGTSKIFGRPRLQLVYNRLVDLVKSYGGSGQGLWLGGYPGISFETAPGFEDAEIENESAMKEHLKNFADGYQRWIHLQGQRANVMQVNITNPQPFIEAYLQNIGLAIGVPWRKLLGSEQGQLASGEDGETWDNRVLGRCKGFCTDGILRPIIRRLMWLGCCPIPKQYEAEWPDRTEPKASEQALTAKTLTDAFASYVGGQVSQLVPPQEYLDLICKLPLADVIAIAEASKKFTDLTDAADLRKQQQEAAIEGTTAKTAAMSGGAEPPNGKGAPVTKASSSVNDGGGK